MKHGWDCRRLSSARQPFYTGYFAAVMATGIVSSALLLYGRTTASDVLLILASVLYVVLWMAYVKRALINPQGMWRDMRNPATTFGFFTIVAGSNVLAVRFLLAHWVGVALGLGAVGIVVWVLLFYTVMTVLVTGPAVRLTDVNGGWLIAVVAEQSIATYLAALVDVMPSHGTMLFLVATSFWAMGLMFYVIFLGFIMDRLFFRAMTFGELEPPYWINMGATAITVLASSRLLEVHIRDPALLTLHPFLQGITLMLWAWGSWWIPLLVILGLWKYGRGHERVRYQPAQWSIVFPLGMYATATTTMAQLAGFHPLRVVGSGFVWIAVAAWLLVAGLAAGHWIGQWRGASSLRVRRRTLL